ncbi:Gfo/Idh/MocA family protein [Curtobacterium sp. RRHDQ10]|uniref:Gfo/Idh/MocA family protein n=1 Tax=Curtobacterium phyllosphaerae TaxID=3413379 RepID=UPI003BF05814
MDDDDQPRPRTGMNTDGPIRYTVVGTGWRSQFFLRIARALPDTHVVASVVTRDPDAFDRTTVGEHVPVVSGLEQAIDAGRPDFVIVSVPRAVAPGVIRECVRLGVPVLTETPPAADLDGLRALWDTVGADDLVQVAEQYPSYPGHAARRAIVEQGVIGTPHDVQVSSTHDYHAVALIRSLLGSPARGAGPVAVTAHRSAFELADPQDRGGGTGHAEPVPIGQLRVHLDLGDGRTGLHDFTDNQWHNPLRHRRVVVRGSLGEISDDRAVHLVDPRTVVDSELVRRQIGVDLDLDGADLDHIQFEGRVVWRNPWVGARFMDDEIATATLLHETGRWARGLADGPYPLREGLQDTAIALAFAESAASGTTVTVAPEAWTA